MLLILGTEPGFNEWQRRMDDELYGHKKPLHDYQTTGVNFPDAFWLDGIDV